MLLFAFAEVAAFKRAFDRNTNTRLVFDDHGQTKSYTYLSFGVLMLMKKHTKYAVIF